MKRTSFATKPPTQRMPAWHCKGSVAGASLGLLSSTRCAFWIEADERCCVSFRDLEACLLHCRNFIMGSASVLVREAEFIISQDMSDNRLQ